jgi:ribosome assembly protein 1
MPKMLYPEIHEGSIEPKNKLETDLFSCNADATASVVAYVSKMFAVSRKDLPENKKQAVTAEEMRAKAKAARAAREAAAAGLVADDTDPAGDGGPIGNEPVKASTLAPEGSVADELMEADEELIGFARLYSGTIRVGGRIACVLPKYSATVEPTHPRNVKHLIWTEVEALYVMMGRELVPVDTVRAGNVFAIKGLEGKVWRNATLCSPGEDEIGNAAPDRVRESFINLSTVSQAVSLCEFIMPNPSSPYPFLYPDGTNCQGCPWTSRTRELAEAP